VVSVSHRFSKKGPLHNSFMSVNDAEVVAVAGGVHFVQAAEPNGGRIGCATRR